MMSANQEIKAIIEDLLNAEIEFCPMWTDYIEPSEVEKLTNSMMQKVMSLPIVQAALKVQPELKSLIREKILDFLTDNAEHTILCDEYDRIRMPLFYVYVLSYVCDKLKIC